MTVSLEQEVALIEEATVSAGLLHAGLGSLQNIDGANDFYHLPMLALASGIERLLKVLICLDAERRTGHFPTLAELKEGRNGHDLERLLDRVVDLCYDSNCRQRPAVNDDYNALVGDGRLRTIVGVLSKFAQSSRYHHLDVVTGVQSNSVSPDDAWMALEMEVLKDYGDVIAQLRSDPNLHVAYEKINYELVRHIERLIRALIRLMTLSDLGVRARQVSTKFHQWLMLKDEQLGRSVYNRVRGGAA